MFFGEKNASNHFTYTTKTDLYTKSLCIVYKEKKAYAHKTVFFCANPRQTNSSTQHTHTNTILYFPLKKIQNVFAKKNLSGL